MKFSPILVASVAALALFSAPALAAAPLASPPAPAQVAPAQVAPAQAAQAAPAQAAPAQAAPGQATPTRSNDAADLQVDRLDLEGVRKLSDEQLAELLRRRGRTAADPSAEELIPIVISVSCFLFLFLGVTGGLYFGARKDRERHETLRAMIQRGGTIPPELLVPPVKKASDLRRGLILVAGGLGLSIFVAATPADNGVWTVGLIPILIGTGYLITWKLMRPESPPIRDEAAIAAEREVNNL